MNKKTVLARSDTATFEVIDGEAVVIDTESGAYYALNDTGTTFWQMLDGEQPIEAHAANMAKAYDVDVERVIADFVELADEMVAAELVTVVDTQDIG